MNIRNLLCLVNNVACIKCPVIPLFQLYTWMYSAIMGTLTIQQENRCDMRWIPVESAFRCLKPEDALETFSFFLILKIQLFFFLFVTCNTYVLLNHILLTHNLFNGIAFHSYSLNKLRRLVVHEIIHQIYLKRNRELFYQP